MRPSKTLMLAPCLAALPLMYVFQEGGGDDPQESPALPPATLGKLITDEGDRLREKIEGAWLLQMFEPAEPQPYPSEVRGFAMFHDGYLTLSLLAESYADEFLGDGLQIYVQGGGYRYRITDQLELQTAAILGYSNFDDEERIVFEQAGNPREFKVAIDDEGTVMTMTKPEGSVLHWSRVTETAFPQASADYLDSIRGR